MDFLIYYETVPREYENACLLKAELERRGYTVKICNTIRRDYWKSRFYSPKVIMMHGLYSDMEINWFINQNRPSVRTKVVDLRYEQLVYKNDKGEPRNLPRGKAAEAYHICWGDASVEELSKFGIDKKYLIKVGPLQFDLANKVFKNYFMSRAKIAEQFHLDQDKKWILFTSTLAYGMMPEEQIRHISVSQNRPEMIPYAKYVQNVAKMLIEWLERFLTKYPDIYYIYRPHPSEFNDAVFHDLQNKCPNFRVIRDYSVKQWFHVVDVVNTWNSTSIMECYLCQKPCCVIDLPESEELKSLKISIIDRSKIIRTYDDFENFNINVNAFDEKKYPLLKEEAQRNYYNENFPVYYHLCDFLEEVYKKDSYYETFSIDVTEKLKKTVKAYRKSTLRGDIVLKLYPFLHKLYPKKFAVDPRLNLHSTKRLSTMEKGIRESVLKISKTVEEGESFTT